MTSPSILHNFLNIFANTPSKLLKILYKFVHLVSLTTRGVILSTSLIRSQFHMRNSLYLEDLTDTAVFRAFGHYLLLR